MSPEQTLANRARAKAHYWKNRDAKLQYQKRYQEENRDSVLAYKAEYRKKNSAQLVEKVRNYRASEPEAVRLRRLTSNAKYRSQHLPQYATHAQKRRAMKAEVSVNPENIEQWWNRTRSQSEVRCYYCSQPTAGKMLHMEHVVPLSRGGEHSISNVCASCAPCNLSKNSKLPSEWDKLPQRFLSL